MRDAEFDGVLETVLARKSVFSALSGDVLHRRELEAELDVSTSTCHRIVRSLEGHGVLERTADGCRLTALGRVVAAQTAAFEQNVRTAYRLEPLLGAFERADVDFDVALFADATVTRAEPDDPSPPINRYLELFRRADTIRTVDRTSFVPPLYVEKLFELAVEEQKDGRAIYPKSVVEKRLSKYPDIHRAAARTREPFYRVCDGVPFGMTLYDGEHVGLRAYDDETGALLLFTDTDDPDAVAWGRDVYDHYHEQSDPLSAVDELPDWTPDDIRQG